VPAITAAAHFDYRIGRKPPEHSPLLFGLVSSVEKADRIGFDAVPLAVFSSDGNQAAAHNKSLADSLFLRHDKPRYP
jgi:hypothetical protein